jgi:hypothetical protein
MVHLSRHIKITESPFLQRYIHLSRLDEYKWRNHVAFEGTSVTDCRWPEKCWQSDIRHWEQLFSHTLLPSFLFLNRLHIYWLAPRTCHLPDVISSREKVRLSQECSWSGEEEQKEEVSDEIKKLSCALFFLLQLLRLVPRASEEEAKGRVQKKKVHCRTSLTAVWAILLLLTLQSNYLDDNYCIYVQKIRSLKCILQEWNVWHLQLRLAICCVRSWCKLKLINMRANISSAIAGWKTNELVRERAVRGCLSTGAGLVDFYFSRYPSCCLKKFLGARWST